MHLTDLCKSPALSPQTKSKYATIIDGILASSDLNTISAKRIRKGLQERLDHDISEQKVRWIHI